MRQCNNAILLKMAQGVTVSAPGKLVLFGEHAVVYGQPAIVTAVGQRMFVTVDRVADPVLRIDAPDVEVTKYEKDIRALGRGNIPKGARFLEEAARNFFAKYKCDGGIAVTTRSEFSAKLGFGSSSAAAACVVRALAEAFKVTVSQREVFDLAYKTVMDIQKKGSGIDIAAAVWGGTLLFKRGGELVEPLELKELPLIIGYTGVKADTVTLMAEVTERFVSRQAELDALYGQMGQATLEAKKALQSSDWKQAGALMNSNQTLLDQLGVSSPILDALIAAARSAGAFGAKLSGAGKGDCMLALVPKDRHADVARAIEKAGGQYVDVRAGVPGVSIE